MLSVVLFVRFSYSEPVSRKVYIMKIHLMAVRIKTRRSNEKSICDIDASANIKAG